MFIYTQTIFNTGFLGETLREAGLVINEIIIKNQYFYANILYTVHLVYVLENVLQRKCARAFVCRDRRSEIGDLRFPG